MFRTAGGSLTHITTRRLRIEGLRREHAAALFAALADPSIYVYIPEDPPESADALAGRYARLAEGAPAGSGQIWLNWAVRLRGSPAYIGTLQATVLRDRTASIAYVLAPLHWGHGYATEACRWLLGHLAIERRVVEFQATTDVRNEASWRLLERLRFVRMGEEPAQCHGQAVTDFRYRRGAQRGDPRHSTRTDAGGAPAAAPMAKSPPVGQTTGRPADGSSPALRAAR